MTQSLSFPAGQSDLPDLPDLFVRSGDELRAEIRRHGGRTPPRYIAEAPGKGDEVEEDAPFSPVRFAEALRAEQARADRPGLPDLPAASDAPRGDNVIFFDRFATARR